MRNFQKRAYFFIGVAAFVKALAISISANAATIDLRTSANTVDVLSGGGATAIHDNKTSSTDTISDNQTSATLNSNISNPGEYSGSEFEAGSTTSTAQANIVTGELKASTTTSYTGQYGEIYTSGFAEVTLSETFSATGAGNAQFFYSVDGTYDLTTLGSSSVGFQALANLTLQRVGSASIGYDSFGINQSSAGVCPSIPCTSASGNIDHLLSFSVYLNDSYQYMLTAYLLAQILTGDGAVDLSNTGKLLIVTDATLQLTPLDENFLTDPTFNVSQTPLPTALPLFVTGLGGLGLLGWRRKRKAAAAVAL